MSSENRPRERLMSFGPNALSDAELLAIILGSGTKDQNVVDLSQRLVAEFGVSGLANASINELSKMKGIGNAKACQISAIFELSKRGDSGKKARITNAGEAARHLLPKLSDKLKEYVVVLMLDTKNNIIKEETIAIGTLDASLVHPREVFNPAIKNNAAAIIIAHNHPSGSAEPSDEDIRVTAELKKASEIIGIRLLDHIIIGRNEWRSV